MKISKQSPQNLQVRLVKLNDCRCDLANLVYESQSKLTKNDSFWFRNSLGTTYIGENPSKLIDPFFITGVCKNQSDNFNLTPDDA